MDDSIKKEVRVVLEPQEQPKEQKPLKEQKGKSTSFLTFASDVVKGIRGKGYTIAKSNSNILKNSIRIIVVDPTSKETFEVRLTPGVMSENTRET